MLRIQFKHNSDCKPKANFEMIMLYEHGRIAINIFTEHNDNYLIQYMLKNTWIIHIHYFPGMHIKYGGPGPWLWLW